MIYPIQSMFWKSVFGTSWNSATI